MRIFANFEPPRKADGGQSRKRGDAPDAYPGETDELVRLSGLLSPAESSTWGQRRAAMLADVQLRVAALAFAVELPAAKPGNRRGRPSLHKYLMSRRAA